MQLNPFGPPCTGNFVTRRSATVRTVCTGHGIDAGQNRRPPRICVYSSTVFGSRATLDKIAISLRLQIVEPRIKNWVWAALRYIYGQAAEGVFSRSTIAITGAFPCSTFLILYYNCRHSSFIIPTADIMLPYGGLAARIDCLPLRHPPYQRYSPLGLGVGYIICFFFMVLEVKFLLLCAIEPVLSKFPPRGTKTAAVTPRPATVTPVRTSDNHGQASKISYCGIIKKHCRYLFALLYQYCNIFDRSASELRFWGHCGRLIRLFTAGFDRSTQPTSSADASDHWDRGMKDQSAHISVSEYATGELPVWTEPMSNLPRPLHLTTGDELPSIISTPPYNSEPSSTSESSEFRSELLSSESDFVPGEQDYSHLPEGAQTPGDDEVDPYWVWDQARQQFRHQNETTGEFVWCPESFD